MIDKVKLPEIIQSVMIHNKIRNSNRKYSTKGAGGLWPEIIHKLESKTSYLSMP